METVYKDKNSIPGLVFQMLSKANFVKQGSKSDIPSRKFSVGQARFFGPNPLEMSFGEVPGKMADLPCHGSNRGGAPAQQSGMYFWVPCFFFLVQSPWFKVQG
jgi:hypothetical protein